MSHTITIRLPADLAQWLAETSSKSGVPQGKIIRDAVEKVRAQSKSKPFMRLAGSIRGGPKDVSSRKGFAPP